MHFIHRAVLGTFCLIIGLAFLPTAAVANPLGPRVIGHLPGMPVSLHTEAFSSVTIFFDEAIEFDPGGGGSFTVLDVAIIGPDGEVFPTAIQSLSPESYEVSFPPQTTPGVYTISVGPDIADLDGYLMDQDDDGIDGEIEDDVYEFEAYAEESLKVFSEDFDPPGVWEIDNGVWEIGTPTVGPSACRSGLQCAGTVLDGNYPYYTDSRLISAAVDLPGLVGDERLLLRYWQWFSYVVGDSGQVQLSVWDSAAKSWSAWEPIGDPVTQTSAVWSSRVLDLSAYTGERVRLAFYHIKISTNSSSTGWYLDDIKLEVKVPFFSGDFESGWDDWFADHGLWEVGAPSAGPGVCPAHLDGTPNTQCAGTVLDGAYPGYTDSRLISAPVDLPGLVGDEQLLLRYWQWFSYYGPDRGQVQLSTWDAESGAWSDWVPVNEPVQNLSGVWSPRVLNLSTYAGQRVRLGFYHISNFRYAGRYGWYLDNIELLVKVPEFTGDFEAGWDDWSADNGVWEVGTPTAGPGGCPAHEDGSPNTQCMGTVLNDNYPAGTASRLISAPVVLPDVAAEEHLLLRYWQWFSYYRTRTGVPSNDWGQVQLSVWDAAVEGWSAWEPLGDLVHQTSAVWSPRVIDLSAYAGERVRLAFYHHGVESRAGWYLDDIELVVKIPTFTGDFESGWADWSADRGLWEVGTPMAGPGGCPAHVDGTSNTQCVGTVLDGNHPYYTDSRLISAAVDLPSVVGGERVLLRFWQWFSYVDTGQVELSTWDLEAKAWSAWESVGEPVIQNSAVWSPRVLDLTVYAGQRVRIAFSHIAISGSSTSTGWYLDDIKLEVKTPAFTGDFESGWDDWFADRGLWEVGVPTVGPSGCPVHADGTPNAQCVGTVLDGAYPGYTDSRLISAPMDLPGVVGDEQLLLRYWQWFSYYGPDHGQLQLSVWDTTAEAWSTWMSVGEPVQNNSDVWSQRVLDMSAYAGQRVRLAFYHIAEFRDSGRTGWYLDDIAFYTNANTAPTIAPIANQTVTEGDSLTLAVSATDAETPDNLTLTASGVPAFGTFTDHGDGTGTFQFNPLTGDAQIYPITLSASDGSLISSATFYLTVNRPADLEGPQITDIRFEGVLLVDGTVITQAGTLSCAASDPAAVARVDFAIDTTLIGTDRNGVDAYSMYWPVADVTDGPHNVVITAYDTFGNPTTATRSVSVALAPPPAPIITQPSDGLVTNELQVTVSGTAEPGSEVLLYRNGEQISAALTLDYSNAFSGPLALVEGTNRIQAAARNRAGIGELNAPVTVTVDLEIPEAPTGLSATSRPAGEIRLQWQAVDAATLAGYDLYRASQSFSTTDQAAKVNVAPFTGTLYDDLPPAEGWYYYRVVAVTDAGKVSAPSPEANALSDATPPRALSLDYVSTGPFDPLTGRMAPGLVDVVMTLSEPVAATPFLSINSEGAAPHPVVLTRSADTQYQGSFEITPETPSGIAYAVFSAKDLAGNIGTVIDAGLSILIDTEGPAVGRVTITPAEPIQNDTLSPVSVSVSIELSEALPPDQTPTLAYLLSDPGREPVPVMPLTQSAETLWAGSFTLPGDAGLTQAETFSFSYSAMDDLGNLGTDIQGDNLFQVYQGDLPPLDPPTGLIAEARPGGAIQLRWDPVLDAADYQLYRQAPGEPELIAYQRAGGSTDFLDATAVDGLYHYAVASVRRANEQEAVSAYGEVVAVEADSIPPEAPTNLTLALLPAGVSATWEAPVIFLDDFEDQTLDKWTIGGRQVNGTNIADVVFHNNSYTGHLYKDGFSEITLEKQFNYNPSLNFYFDMEVNATTGAVPTDAYYGLSGINFSFLDVNGDSLGWVSFSYATTSDFFDRYNPLPNAEVIQINNNVMESYALTVNEILSLTEIDESLISTVNMYYRTYSSTSLIQQYGVTAELWLDNVCVGIDGGCAPTSGNTIDIQYALYRASAEILSVEGLTPILTGIADLTAFDTAPIDSEHFYAVTALDAAGNESPPSASAFLAFDILPLASLQVEQVDIEYPVLSWTHTGTNVAGYNVYLGSSQTPLNNSPLLETSFTDLGFDGGERDYTVTAVDLVGTESLGRSVRLPAIEAVLNASARVERNLFTALDYQVINNSSSAVSGIQVHTTVDTHTQTSAVFELQAAETRGLPVIVPGYPDLPDLSPLSTAIQVTQPGGEQARIIRTGQIEVADGALVAGVLTQDFTRGASGTVRFTLENTGDLDIELVTARNFGTAPSDEIVFALLSADDNVLATQRFQQGVGEGLVTLSSGTTITRIPPGGIFTSAPLEIAVPLAAPDDVFVRVNIAQVHYHLEQTDAVSLPGPSTRQAVRLIDVAFGCAINSILPAYSLGDEPILISGSAISMADGSPMPLVPLKLIIRVNGFERSYDLYSNTTGAFSYSFQPLAGESGHYEVACIHPALLERPTQGEFTIGRVFVTPTQVQLTLPFDTDQLIPLRVMAGGGAPATNLTLHYDAIDQPDGTLAAGITLTLSDPITLQPGESGDMSVSVRGDASATSTGAFIVTLKSDESGTETLASVRVDYTLFDPATASPDLVTDPSNIVTGVTYGNRVSETLTLENRGLAEALDVRVGLLSPDGNPAPDWLFLTTPADIGSLSVGETSTIELVAAPTNSVLEGNYEFRLQFSAANHTAFQRGVFVTVTTSDIGIVQFHVSDIYTQTLNAAGELIEGLEGATIKVQNQTVSTVEQTLTTDIWGNALFENLPAGMYKYRASAPDHADSDGFFWIKPGITVNQEVFLHTNLITLEWSVREITLEDRYEIILSATYETDVPAPVVVTEPPSVTLPPMQPGEVYYGQYDLVNYGLVRADALSMLLPAPNAYFKFELLSGLPASLAAKQRVTIAYRVTGLSALAPQAAATGGGTCELVKMCPLTGYTFTCANGSLDVSGVYHCIFVPLGDCLPSSGNSPDVTFPPLTDLDLRPVVLGGSGGSAGSASNFTLPSSSGDGTLTLIGDESGESIIVDDSGGDSGGDSDGDLGSYLPSYTPVGWPFNGAFCPEACNSSDCCAIPGGGNNAGR